MWKGFQKPKRLAAELESLTDKFGKFSAQPFERGWGTTVGNALRRALLSSIEGAAITAVKIEGVLHEFSSIPGVVEDATDIILNLKQVPLKLNNDQSKTIFVNVENPGVDRPFGAVGVDRAAPTRRPPAALPHYTRGLGPSPRQTEDPAAVHQSRTAAAGSVMNRRVAHLLTRLYPDRKSTRLNSSHLGISYAVF